MNAFISYSHQDDTSLEMLHKHLAQLLRDKIIKTWTDKDIYAGGTLNKNIDAALNKSEIFIALLSPDYIASGYCYEKEFKKALEMQEHGDLIIAPIIIEPCDWLNTPFKEFKALPKDGKPISTWLNRNTAFLDVVQNLRNLIVNVGMHLPEKSNLKSTPLPVRNYRVKKDFDSIEKMEFIEKTFAELKDFLKRYTEEITAIDKIKVRILNDTDKEFQCLLVNRNKIDAESHLKISYSSENNALQILTGSTQRIEYSIGYNNRPSVKAFSLTFDEFHLFWFENEYYSNSRSGKELDAKEMADKIWNQWLESVGILL
jgi:hypothetical protein